MVKPKGPVRFLYFLVISATIHWLILCIHVYKPQASRSQCTEITLGALPPSSSTSGPKATVKGAVKAVQPKNDTLPVKRACNRHKRRAINKRPKNKSKRIRHRVKATKKRHTRTQKKRAVTKKPLTKRQEIKAPIQPGKARDHGSSPGPKHLKVSEDISPGRGRTRPDTRGKGHAEGPPGKATLAKGLKNYLTLIQRIIDRHKYYPYNARIFGRQGKVRVCFIIKRDGAIKDPRIITPSRFKSLNRAALKTLMRSSPLPPPPSSLSPPLRVEFDLEFKIR